MQFHVGDSDERPCTWLFRCKGFEFHLLKALLVVFLSTTALLATLWWAAARKPFAHQRLVALRATPISIRPNPQRCLSIPAEDFRRITDQVQPLNEGMDTSSYLHSLRVFGLNSKYHRGKLASSAETLRLFVDEDFSKRILGMPLIVRTRYGVRCTAESGGSARESHRDYCLAVLSEQGLPISFSMNFGRDSFTFKDFLTDSIANFHLGQAEIEWTALAYAMWIPPERKWCNKYSETFTFDQLAAELMQRPIDKGVCAGSHLVQAMIVLSRVDRERYAILSPNVRADLLHRLKAIVREVEATQAADGSWGTDWHKGLVDNRDPRRGEQDGAIYVQSIENRLLATSHISEWLMLLPNDFRVSDSRLALSGRWLHAHLRNADSKFVKDNFCPCTHGAIVLQLLHNDAAEIAPGPIRHGDSNVRLQ